MFAALVYDWLGSYDLAFRLFAAYFAAAALLVWLAGKPPPVVTNPAVS